MLDSNNDLGIVLLDVSLLSDGQKACFDPY